MSTGSTRCAEPRAASPVHDSPPHFHCPVSLEELRRRHSTLSVACPAAGLRLWRKGVHLPEDLGILLAVPLRQARQGAPRHQARAGQGPRRWVAPPRHHLRFMYFLATTWNLKTFINVTVTVGHATVSPPPLHFSILGTYVVAILSRHVATCAPHWQLPRIFLQFPFGPRVAVELCWLLVQASSLPSRSAAVPAAPARLQASARMLSGRRCAQFRV